MRLSKQAMRIVSMECKRFSTALLVSARQCSFLPRITTSHFSTARMSHNAHDDNYKAHVIDHGNAMIVFFNHECQARFHAPWLWSNDPAHIHATSGQRIKTPGDYPGTKIESASIVPKNDNFVRPPSGSLHPIGGIYTTSTYSSPNLQPWMLRVIWKVSGKEQCTFYNLDWLKERIYCEEYPTKEKRKTEVTPQHALKQIINSKDPIQKFNFQSLEQTNDTSFDENVFHLLHAIVQDGAAIVEDTPLITTSSDASIRKLGNRLSGSLSHGALYGDVFQVKSTSSAINIAYTNVTLPPHTDMGYYESPPGLQFLHCISNDVTGGQSILIDALAAAHAFRRLCPDLFEILTICSATFVKQREGVDMVYRRPHIVIQGDEIVSVNWSPSFEGPLNIPAHLVEDYYVAYCAFQKLVDKNLPLEHGSYALSPNCQKILHEYAKEYTWERKLVPGEVLVFNNRRMLHGRKSFCMNQSSTVGRHLTGCYTNIDESMSHYRVLLRERKGKYDQSIIPNVGNGSSSTV